MLLKTPAVDVPANRFPVPSPARANTPWLVMARRVLCQVPPSSMLRSTPPRTELNLVRDLRGRRAPEGSRGSSDERGSELQAMAAVRNRRKAAAGGGRGLLVRDKHKHEGEARVELILRRRSA